MLNRSAVRSFATLVALIAVSACASARTAAPVGYTAAASAAMADVADAGVREYRLGSGDKIHLTTYGEDNLTGDFSVAADGTIAFPLIGVVKAEGLTTLELSNAVGAALRDGYLKDPKISIEVVVYRPFYILGEVAKPGPYPYSVGLTAQNAVATANGFTYRADTKKVFIKHVGEATEHLETLTPSLLVQPGDTIRVRERYF